MNKVATCSGKQVSAAAASREITALAVKQHFSMARTLDSFPAPQLYPTAGCRESHIP